MASNVLHNFGCMKCNFVKSFRIMCGIAAFFAKTGTLRGELGNLFTPMMGCLTGRGPDSAGFAVYRDPSPPGFLKSVIQHTNPSFDWVGELSDLGAVSISPISSHCIALFPGEAEEVRKLLSSRLPGAVIMSLGVEMEIFKETGLPCDVMARFRLSEVTGSHAIGHTRMATESAVTTAGSHPFSTGSDLCLVHNGSLSNHNRLRRLLQREGIEFRTDNDSEVAAGYLSWRLQEGDSLEAALGNALKDLDGFFTFAIGTRDGFAVLRDPIACKPAVLAETADYVAMASEYRALAHLPGVEKARIWEPEPGRIHTWTRSETLEPAAA